MTRDIGSLNIQMMKERIQVKNVLGEVVGASGPEM